MANKVHELALLARNRRAQAGVLAQLALGLGISACSPVATYRIAVVPSLRPVDTARPLVVFSQVRGEACGRDAVTGAVRDMKRLEPIDGYLEVTIEETGSGDERCARATAYPFRYGSDPDMPHIRVGPESTEPALLPGREPAGGQGSVTQEGPFDCKVACGRIADLGEGGTVMRALVNDRCIQRCQKPDEPFQRCIAQAQDRAAASQCLGPAEGAPSEGNGP